MSIVLTASSDLRLGLTGRGSWVNIKCNRVEKFPLLFPAAPPGISFWVELVLPRFFVTDPDSPLVRWALEEA